MLLIIVFIRIGLHSLEEISSGKATWDLIFQPSNFFTKYKLVFIIFDRSVSKYRAGMVGAVGKISAFRPQGPQLDPRLCRDLN